MTVRLGPDQIAMAELVGARRFDSCARAGSPTPHYSVPPDGRRKQQHSAGAELAAARYIGGHWAATDTIPPQSSGADIRLGRSPLQVRWSPRDDGFLFLYEEDDPRDTFVLVTGALPAYEVRGMLRCAEGQVDEHWRTHFPGGAPLETPCWCIPQIRLRRIAR